MSSVVWRGLDSAGEVFVVSVSERRDADRFLSHMQAIVTETDLLLQSADDELPDPMTQRAILDQLSRIKNCLCLIAHRPGLMRQELLGSITLLGGTTRRSKHIARLGMGVRRFAWRRGIGRRLVEQSIAWANQSSVVERVALQVYASNTAAMRLYEDTGFEIDGRLIDEVQLEDRLEDLITMSIPTTMEVL
jgi:RimJ/RimL family protein N-acetyltransferase